MPHIIIKLWPGKTREQKKELAEKFTQDMSETLGVPEKGITIAFDEVCREEWYDKVHVPLIDGNTTGEVFKPDGYKGFRHRD